MEILELREAVEQAARERGNLVSEKRKAQAEVERMRAELQQQQLLGGRRLLDHPPAGHDASHRRQPRARRGGHLGPAEHRSHRHLQ